MEQIFASFEVVFKVDSNTILLCFDEKATLLKAYAPFRHSRTSEPATRITFYQNNLLPDCWTSFLLQIQQVDKLFILLKYWLQEIKRINEWRKFTFSVATCAHILEKKALRRVGEGVKYGWTRSMFKQAYTSVPCHTDKRTFLIFLRYIACVGSR